jgi:hypothetical protein
MLSILALTLLLGGACRQADISQILQSEESSQSEDVKAAEETAALAEAEAQARARAEAEAAERAELEAAERALAEREALLAEREEQLREAEALQAERERLAARSAAVEDRERILEERTADLEARESLLEAREFDVLVREEALADEDATASGSEEVADWLGDEKDLDEGQAGSTPSAEPSARTVEASLLPGKVLEVEMLETLSSRDSRVGDTFSAHLVQDLRNEDGILVIPAGAEILGEVTHVVPLKKVGGRAELGIEFTHVVVSPDQTVEIRASMVEVGKDKRKDKKKILISTAAGAILGRILGGDTEGAVAGAAVGAAATTAAVAATAKGKDAEIPAGEMVALQLEEVVTVSIEMTGPVDS